MSHDLHFTVQNGDGTQIQTHDGPISGDMDHLPESSSPGDTSSSQQPGVLSLQYIQEKLNQSSHPVVIIFHLLFKAVALFLYIFGGWFLPSGNSAEQGGHFISLTVAIILLLAADFWVVKNVTGRLLVGLRWWNKVDNDTTTWIFEAAEDKAVNQFDRTVFWTVLYATPCVWVAMAVLGVLKMELSWLMIVFMALALSGANVYGYYKCSSDQKVKFQQMMQTGAQRGAVAMMQSSVLSVLTGTAQTGNRSSTYV
jgi:Eukaryotic protein of unknown function (DUF846)